MNKIGNIDDEIKNIMSSPFKYGQMTPISKLVEVLKKLNYHYYNTDEPLIPDAVYDLLYEILEERDPDNIFLKEVGTPISKDLVKLPYYMDSLDKIRPYEENKFNSWINKHQGPYVISDKLDGISGLLHKKGNALKLYTRGDASSGQNISHLIPYILNKKEILINLPNTIAIRGEIIIPRKDFKNANTEYKNIRNAVSGLVNSKNFNIELAKISKFIGYAILDPRMKFNDQLECLEKYNFPVVEHKKIKKIDVKYLEDYLKDRRKNGDYDSDGIVISDNSKIYPLNTLKKYPSYSFAFKTITDDQVAEAKVVNVLWEPSRLGYWKPTIQIEPVDLIGVTITYVTAHNAKFIVDNKLGPGSIIKIIRSGDVIPKIEKVIISTTAKLPDFPYKWNKTGVDLLVQDIHAEQKDTITTKSIDHFFKTLGIKYISEGIIANFVSHGYNSIFKILNADQNKLLDIDGIGQKLISKIYEGIIISFDTITLEQLMAASSVFGRGMGVRKLKLIVDSIPNIMEIKLTKKELTDKILNIEGYDNITTSLFVDNFDKFKEFFEKIENIDYISVSRLKKPIKKEKKSNTFDGMKIVFTGFRSKELEQFIVDNVGQITNSISKNTSLLVHKDSETSSKYTKAQELGIQIMTEDEFRKKYL